MRRIILAAIAILFLLIASPCLSGSLDVDGLGVKEIDRVDGMVLFALKIDVTNNGTKEDVIIYLQGTDKEGFERDKEIITGNVPKGRKETLTTQGVMKAKDYDSIIRWKASN